MHRFYGGWHVPSLTFGLSVCEATGRQAQAVSRQVPKNSRVYFGGIASYLSHLSTWSPRAIVAVT
jgi:hypothetical protein